MFVFSVCIERLDRSLDLVSVLNACKPRKETALKMILVALTGGIGSGKSSVSSALADRGAAIVDADQIVRQLQRSGEPVFEAMVEWWGQSIVDANGELDRGAVASIVFADKDELKKLEDLIHPAIGQEMRRQMNELAATDRVVILDIPLLAEGDGDRRGASAVIVVDCPIEIATERLVEFRNFDRSDAAARIDAQVTREERLKLADFVIDNGGTLSQLDAEVARCWEWLQQLDPTQWPPPEPSAEDGT